MRDIQLTLMADALGPEESYLWKEVETELGTEMIRLKMRCGGLGSDWGKVSEPLICIIQVFSWSLCIRNQWHLYHVAISDLIIFLLKFS